MLLPFFWIDAFTAKVFAGNPAGVMPLEAWLPDDLMQQLARENSLAETAFFVRTGENRYHLRWFSPAMEIDLCGHATLASAQVLFCHLGLAAESVTFDTRSGPLVVRRLSDGLLELDFPSRPGRPIAVDPALTAALGAQPRETAQARDTLCVFQTAAEVRALRPNFAALALLDTFGVIATAPGEDCDFVSRFFVPRAGINEDPVTGSAHCTLVPYWADRLAKSKLHAKQISVRGGELWCELQPTTGSGQGSNRVGIAGHAALYLRGTIEV